MSGPTEPALITAGPAPAGVTWQLLPRPGAAFEIPAGDGWTRDDHDPFSVTQDASGLVVMVQVQPNIPAEARDEYVTSFIGVNQRDAPQYAVTARQNGSVAGFPATRVDGRFNNGRAFVTRDYVIFAGGTAYMVMARVPVGQEALLQAIIDHIAASIRLA